MASVLHAHPPVMRVVRVPQAAISFVAAQFNMLSVDSAL